MSKRPGSADVVNIAMLSLPIGTFQCHTKAMGNKNAFFIWLRDLFFRIKGGAQNANFYFFTLRDLQFSNFPRAENKVAPRPNPNLADSVSVCGMAYQANPHAVVVHTANVGCHLIFLGNFICQSRCVFYT